MSDGNDSEALGRALLDAACERMRQQKALAEAAAARLSDEAFFQALGPGENSVALLMKHMGGNLRSRWTDFLVSDGEKPWRRRDAEFEREEEDTRASILEAWEEGWQVALGTLGSLESVDLLGTVTVRGEATSVAAATLRQLAHAAYHAGQIVFLARHLVGEEAWASLSIPRGGSESHAPDAGREAGGGP